MILSRIVRYLGYLGLIVIAVFATACGDNPPTPAAPTALQQQAVAPTGGPVASTAAPTESAAKYEQDFMLGMIDHHQMAIEMAQMCLKKAVHEELGSMCEDIMATQSAEIQQMQAWLRDWYGVSYEPMMKPGPMKQMEKLGSLSGDEFEIAFMEMMIRHHRGAVQEGEKCGRRASHEELIQLCRNIISAQTAEIQQMEEWLCSWYGRCGEA